MPTYPYACTECGHAFEVQQSFSDPSLTECPECSGRLRKVFSSVGVVFKGSGFYRTDSRSGAKAGSTTNGGGADGGSSGTSATTTADSGSSTTSTTSAGKTPSAKPAATSAPAASS